MTERKPPSPRAAAAQTDTRDAPGAPSAGQGASVLDPVALAEALRQLMEPLAALAIARGVPFVSLEDQLKTAFVDAARAAHANLPAHRLVSRISTATGINRREVTRLTQARSVAPVLRHSPATRVFTKWLADASLKNRKGEPRPIARQGPAPSFEALAQSVTRDVHPRSLLDELCRLGLVRLDGDTVHVVRDSFVPRSDSGRMLGFLGSNVGDHLRAAVGNIVSDAPAHLEQAVFADEISQASIDAFQQLMRGQWKALLGVAVPALQQLIDADRAAGLRADQRVRVGFYTYHETMASPPISTPTGADVPVPGSPRKPASKRMKE